MATDRWENAKCLSVDIKNDDIFFSDDETDQYEATEFCNGSVDGRQCELRDQCLLFALTSKIEYGVFGGTTPLGRKAILKKLPPKRRKPNPGWRWMSEKEALNGVSDKTISEMRNQLCLE